MKTLRDLIQAPDYVTLFSTVCGLLSVFSSINHAFTGAAILLMTALLFDRLDGKIARLMGIQDRDFGKEIDSLSDAVCFGAAPAVFGYAQGLNHPSAVIILLFFACAGILRLARFNTVKTEKGYYQGMNIAYNGLTFPLAYFLMGLLSLPGALQLNILLILFFLSGFLMLSSVKWKKI